MGLTGVVVDVEHVWPALVLCPACSYSLSGHDMILSSKQPPVNLELILVDLNLCFVVVRIRRRRATGVQKDNKSPGI